MPKTFYKLRQIMSQKRHKKNLKRKQGKPYVSKFDRKQAKIRQQVILEGLKPIQANLLSNLDKSTQEAPQSGVNHHNKTSHPIEP
jgi:hypothetical protein